VRALVTGADGFVGRWLIEHLEASGDEVWAATGSHGAPPTRGGTADLSERAGAEEVVGWAAFDAIYHLAAVSFGPDVEADIGRAIDVTVRGTAYLLDAASRVATPPVMHCDGSGSGHWPRWPRRRRVPR